MGFGAFVRKAVTGRTPWTYLYLALIPFINWCFAAVPQIPLPDNGSWTPMAIVTGFVLIVRDFAQREIKHWVIAALVVGLALSFLTSDPAVALGSTCAFAVSELIDWAIFTFVKRPLSQRVAISTAISSPIDSAVFYMIASISIPGIFNIWSLTTSVLSKLVGVLVVYLVLRRHEAKGNLPSA
ncbi:VUT family protein [Asticcacaulis excentricus]|uniref:Putative preQ0 transporter n=1 Tax=Asticcacaulis excentricus TaxID=78587 RepID=A0A3G9G3H1_9CAUL|nr:VUT family protein [Asticcacaulis excentricus]BBF79603.1 putative preQ0 transporter [Asticcacaulis excentricus]